MRLSTAATEYLHVTVTVDGQPPDPSTTVEFAFLAASDPTEDTVWSAGEWVEGVARILIGPANSGHLLAAGSYRVFVRVTDSPEIPVLRAGYLTVY